jgi:hypothetical protein
MMFRRQSLWWAGAIAALAVLSVSLATAQDTRAPGGFPSYTPGYAAGPTYPANAQSGYSTTSQLSNAWQQPAGPAYRLADRTASPEPTGTGLLQPAAAGEHPLMSTVRWGRAGMVKMEKITDYTAMVAKRERLSGKLSDYQYMYLKLRQKPFSVYLNFLGPTDIKGQEVIYVDGANNGKMWAHTTGLQDTLIGTVSLQPDGAVAMRGQMYPLTAIGVLNLTRRLMEVAEHDTKFGECEVQYFQRAKVNDRVTTCIQVTHPIPRHDFRFNIARIFVDDELNIPIRFEAYDWPKQRGDKPELLEEYTYLNLKLNARLTDQDFDIHNPAYRFH